MEFWNRQKKVLTAFGIFLAFMMLCTLISRVVYASRLPQVSVETPRRTALDHTVTADGIVRQGREYAVTALSGLRVRTVYVNVGDRVTPETLLFDLDMGDLDTKIQDKELEIQKLRLQIAAIEQNRGLEAQKQQTESERAREDYDRAQSRADETLGRAREDLEDAEDAYDAHKKSSVQVTPEQERRRRQKAYSEWSKKEKELKAAAEAAEKAYKEAEEQVKKLEESGSAAPGGEVSGELEAARAQAQEKKKAWEEAAAAYARHTEKPVQKPDFTAEDEALSAWEEKKASLKDAVETAERAVADAEQSGADTMLDAQRKVADTGQTADADSSLEVDRLELSVLQTELSAYQKVRDASGQVYPEAEGIITRVQVSPGERVGDGAALVYADLTSPLQFLVSLTKEQKKYVNQGDTVNLALGGSSKKELKVDYVAENESNPEFFDARVFLPDGIGAIGESGSFEVKAQSETWPVCIPLNALHEDANQRSFVYVVSERAGILGTELTAEMVYVRVLDRNDSFAAVEEGVIDRETEVIVSSTEELEDRAVIRYKE